MGVLRKSLPLYCGVVLRCIALTFFLSIMAAPARSETVPLVPAPATATVQSTGAWFFPSYVIHLSSGIASLFNGYPTGQAACDAYDVWINSTIPTAHAHSYFVLIPDYTDQGLCLPYPSYNQWVASGYIGGPYNVANYQHCPTGYATNNSLIHYPSSATFTCTNNGTAKQCPEVTAGETPFMLDPGGLTCSRCPVNASGTFPDACTCNDGYEPDPTKTSCVPVDTCPQVKALTALPADDVCAQALENLKSTQAQKDAACGSLSQEMKDGKSCLETKLSNTNDLDTGKAIPLRVTADIRDLAYQKHLREIWDKMKKLVRLMRNNPAMQTACAARRAEIAAEKGCDSDGACPKGGCYSPSATQRSHCLKGRPSSSNDAPHTKGNALDVSEDYTIDPLQDALDGQNPPQSIQQFLDGPPDCKLKWGGTFTDNNDPVHFQVR